MTVFAAAASPQVLVEAVVPDVRARDAVVVTSGALLVALLAQITIPLGFTPVPITLQTFGVALVGAATGARRGALALLLYVALGAVGLPFYAGGQGGVEHVAGATGGYLIGFVLAAALIGWLAQRRADRKPVWAFLSFQAGSLVIFTCGILGLIWIAGMSFSEALAKGWLPFVLGDLIKTAVAASLFPGAWLAVRHFRRGESH